ncbi:hypothetical protein GSS88_01365 [Corynebacterium sp. 3HC-13]|uniref:hypothetical protein n=1 Tax=Corynebacterium poyangense TaxID=2684405 RepID=UPI001CCBA0B5|nr:hypothetical protein [Corynebacterium poyangense]MBZ8176449.1 hypothetical protein [Corynebacterium poyangense]
MTRIFCNSLGKIDAHQFRSVLENWNPPGRNGCFRDLSDSSDIGDRTSWVQIYQAPHVVAFIETWNHPIAPESADMENGWSRNEDFSRADHMEELLLVYNCPDAGAGSAKITFLVSHHDAFVTTGEYYDELCELLMDAADN